jgi:signal transduction histidine kinase
MTAERASARVEHRRRLQALGQMTAAVAHEGSNVLLSMQLTLGCLADATAGDPESADLVARLAVGQGQLRRLFEEIRGQVAAVRPDRRACDLRSLWRQAHRNVAALWPGARVRLSERVSAADVTCHADPVLVDRVFRNLFENAVAACPDRAHVRVSCGEAMAGGGPGLRVAVRDGGPGLMAEERERVFEPFYTTRPHGMGLGLAIARRVARAHGGSLTVTDRDGPGAEFVILLPRAAG